MIALLAVNVLIALAWPNHIHHSHASRWFADHQHEGWATCPATQSGFVRVSSKPRALQDARSPREACALMRRVTELPHLEFWSDQVAIATSEWVDHAKLLGHRQVTDAHLLAIAIENGGCLATLDRGIRHLVPTEAAGQTAVVEIDDNV